MVSPYVKAEITAAVTNLGYLEGNKYFKDQYCVEALKDLIRFLRKDDNTFSIRRELGQMKVVTLHLLPIICEYHNDEHLFDVALRLMLNLTNPTLLLYNEELPTDKVQRNQYLQIISHLQSYKPTLASSKLWNVLTDKLKVLLVKEPEERMEDDKLLTERVLILIRNILDIPITPDDEKRTDDDASVHDLVLWAMHQSGLEDVILYLASNENERPYCMHVMEIISLMLREQHPANLANAAAQRSAVEQKKETNELVNLVQRETADREARYRKLTGSRSSIFRGTFCVKDVKSISEKELIVHKSSPDVKSIDFSTNKQSKKKPQNRLPLPGADGTRRSTLAIRLMLKEFCIEVLNGAYNTLMHTVRDCLVRMRTQEHDETYYLWAMKFFMEFNRNGKFKVDLVTETISVGIFHYIQTLVDKYSEMIVVDKKKVASWSKRLHMAVRAYQELLLTISAMDRYGSDEVKRSSRILKGNIFYVLEYREMCMVLLQNYKETQHSVSYLKDLVETTHIFLKLFETHTQGTRHFMIQKKVRARKKRKKTKSKKDGKSRVEETTVDTVPPPEFDELAADITGVLQQGSELPDGMRPYDPLSDAPMDDQKMAALNKIQKLLKETKIPVAVAYLRASRDVWPEGEVFGALDIRPEEELLLLREIFYAALPEIHTEQEMGNGKQDEQDDEEEDDDDEGDEIEEEEMAAVRTQEQELHFDEFVRRFAHCKIVQAYCSLLRLYATNSTLTNHCLVKMLHRIAFDCKMPTMLFQLSLFKTFQKILEDPRSKTDASIKELGRFGAYIVRKFAEASHANPKIFVELLFWKTARDAAEIDVCYGEVQESKSGSRSAWAEEEEDELQRLYEEFKDVHDPERDLVDRIMANMIKQDKSRRLVIKKLKDLGLISGSKELAKTKHAVRVRPPKEWAQNEITELRRIFEEVRDSSDPLGLLIDRLPVRRSRNRVRDKIVELGLVADAKELRKKRGSGKGRKSNKARRDSDSDDDDGGDDDESDGEDVENRPPREPGASDNERFTSEDDTDDSGSGNDDAQSRNGSEREGEPRSKSKKHKKEKKHKKKKKLAKSKRKQYGFGASGADSFEPGALSSSLRQLFESGRKGGLEWLLSCLRETFADRMDDEDDAHSEAIPLLPLGEAAQSAMDDHHFLKFIAQMGLAPPANEQEQYWRIPTALTASHLRKRIDFLDKALDGTGDMDAAPAEAPLGDDSTRTSSRSSNKSGGKRSASPPPSANANRKRRRVVQSDSESDDDTLASLAKQQEETATDAHAAHRVDGGDDDDALDSTAASTTKANRKRFAILDSDSE